MIDWTKPLETKDGRKAEFVRKLNTSSDYKRLVVLTDCHGWESHETYTEEGRLLVDDESALDLINPPPPKRKEVLDGVYVVVGPFANVTYAKRESNAVDLPSVVTTFNNLEIEVE